MSVTSGAPAHMWFVQIGGEVWGPYPEARVAEFVGEGRVKPATLISPFAAGPWTPAADSVEFAGRFGPAPAPGATPAPSAAPVDRVTPLRGRPPPSAASVAPAPAPPERPQPTRAGASGLVRPVLVFAELATVAPAAFHAGLARFGPCVQVRPDLWLLRCAGGAAGLRNQLSAHLGAGDSLLVVEASLDQAAWFNLAPGQDRELRRIWAGA